VNSLVITDQSLILKCKKGCKESYNQLVLKYDDQLVCYLWRRLGSLHEAEDIAQEAFIKAFENINSYNRKSNFNTWLFTIARNLSIDQYRSSKITTISLLDHHHALLEDEQHNRPDSQIQKREEISGVWKLAQSLSSSHYELIQLFYAEDKNIGEIAQITGKTKISVRVGLSRARKALQKKVKDGESLSPLSQSPLAPIVNY